MTGAYPATDPFTADRVGLLPTAAMAGARVRSVVDQIDAACTRLSPLDRPRALVVIGPAAAELALLGALVGSAAPVPFVAVDAVPAWLGPLDLVVVFAGRRHDLAASAAAELAARRGATVLLRAEDEVGAAPGVTLLPPGLGGSETLAAPVRAAVLFTIAARFGLLSLPADDGPAIWPDLLDAFALSTGPASESFADPAVQLAEHLAGPTGSASAVLVGADPLGDALAGVAAGILTAIAGVPAAVIGHREAELSPALLRRAATPRDIFADPEDSETLTVTVLTGDPHRAPDGRGGLIAALPGAFVAELEAPRPGQVLVALSRWTVAAIHLGLSRSTQWVPLDHPEGLGRSGSALGAVRVDEWSTEQRRQPDDEFDRPIEF